MSLSPCAGTHSCTCIVVCQTTWRVHTGLGSGQASYLRTCACARSGCAVANHIRRNSAPQELWTCIATSTVTRKLSYYLTHNGSSIKCRHQEPSGQMGNSKYCASLSKMACSAPQDNYLEAATLTKCRTKPWPTLLNQSLPYKALAG